MTGPPKHVFEPTLLPEELQLAARNHAMPLEALRYDLTPVGLHYLLTHYDIPVVDEVTHVVEVDGRVHTPLSLSPEDLRSRRQVTMPVAMECAGNGRARLSPRPVSQPWLTEAVGCAEWRGTPLADVLRDAGVAEDAVEVVFTGADRGVEGDQEQAYARSLPVEEAMRDDVLLVHSMNGAPLAPQHGFPVRLIVPGWYGMASVKWLRRVTVVAEPFLGYQMTHSYRVRQTEEETGQPVQRILPRSLMQPPGIPDFSTRVRHVPSGVPTELTGRAWSGHGPIVRVEVSDDDGATWSDAEVTPAPGPHAWHAWRLPWTPPSPGELTLACRATDAAGNVQPVDPPWNWGGYLNNAVHRTPVVVD